MQPVATVCSTLCVKQTLATVLRSLPAGPAFAPHCQWAFYNLLCYWSIYPLMLELGKTEQCASNTEHSTATDLHKQSVNIHQY